MAAAIEAGRAVLKLLLDDKELHSKFAGLQRKLRNTGRSIRSAGLGIAGAGAAISAPLVLATQQFLDLGDQLNKMAARTGVSVQALSELKFAAEQSGTGIETVEKAIAKMQKTLLNAENGLAGDIDKLEEFGIAANDLKGLAPERQFEIIAKEIAGIEDPSRRAAAAMNIFGKSGALLLPMVHDMESLRAEARELGITMNDETAQSAADLADAFNRFKVTVVALAIQVGSALSPALIEVADFMKEAVKTAVEFIKNNETLVVVTAVVGASLLAVGTAMVTLGSALSFATFGVGALLTAFTFLTAHPIVAALVVIGLAVAAITGYFLSLGDEAETAGDKIEEAANKATSTGGGAQLEKRQAEAARRAQQISADLQAELANNRVQSAGTGVAAIATDVDRSMLRELVQQNRFLSEILDASRRGGGLIAGGF